MRNYKKEYKKAKENYEHFSIAIDKKLGQELKKQLKQNNTSITKWFENMSNGYIQANKIYPKIFK